MDYPDKICTNTQYEEVDCDDPSAHFRLSKAEAAEKRKGLGKPEPTKPEKEEKGEGLTVKVEVEEKAVKSPPQNKAKSSAEDK